MNRSPLVQAIVVRLQKVGYLEVTTPFRVAAVSFDFTAALRGREGRSLDLILVMDTTTGDFGDRDATMVRHRVEALSRALDVTGSRFVVTVILAGAALAGDVEVITESCRVLSVEALSVSDDGSLDDVASRQLDDRIRGLLPLEIPVQADAGVAGGGAIELIVKSLPAGIDEELLRRVLSASDEGEQAVTEALSELIGRALIIKEDEV